MDNNAREKREFIPLPLHLLTDHVNPNYSPGITEEEREEYRKVLEENGKSVGFSLQFVGAVRGPATTLCVVKLSGETTEKDLLEGKTAFQMLFRTPHGVSFVKDGKNEGYYGILVPNKTTECVSLRKVLDSDAYLSAQGELPVALGKTSDGDVLVEDLASLGNILVTGETGSGKSVFIAQLLTQLIMRYSPERFRFIPVDVKGGVELGIFADAPHVANGELFDSCEKTDKAFAEVVREIRNRLDLLNAYNVKSIKEYNALDGVPRLPYLLFVIDEASEIVLQGRETRSILEKIAEILHGKGKELAIGMLFATQNPVRDVITANLAKNMNTKVVFRMFDAERSMLVLHKRGAEGLCGRGDGLFVRPTGTVRFQCAYASVDDVDNVINALCSDVCQEPEEKEEPAAPVAPAVPEEPPKDEPVETDDITQDEPVVVCEEEKIMWEALRICVETGHVSLSYLQRKLRRGYNFIANLLDEMVLDGYLEQRKEDDRMRLYVSISEEEFEKEWEKRFGKYDPDTDGE